MTTRLIRALRMILKLETMKYEVLYVHLFPPSVHPNGRTSQVGECRGESTADST
jgi:hypothetical protein